MKNELFVKSVLFGAVMVGLLSLAIAIPSTVLTTVVGFMIGWYGRGYITELMVEREKNIWN